MTRFVKAALSTIISIALLTACAANTPAPSPTASPAAMYASPYPTAEDKRFSRSDWYFPAMQRMDEQGVLPAYPGPVYDPYGIMTGSSFYDALARLIKEPSSAFLSSTGYLSLSERLSYGQPVPFYLAALVSARVAGTSSGSRPNKITGTPSQIVESAAKLGLFAGFTTNTPDPNASLTRAQAAVLLDNVAQIWSKSGRDITDVTLYLRGSDETWDLTQLFPSENAWEKSMKQLQDETIPRMSAYKGHLDEKDKLIACMSDMQRADELVQAVYAYASLQSDTDTRDAHFTEMADRATRLSLNFYENTAYIQPELAGLDEKLFNAYLEDDDLAFLHDTLADLQKYRAHLLNPEAESVLAGAQQWTLGNEETFSKLTYSDSRQDEIIWDSETNATLDATTYYSAIYGKDPDLREKVIRALLMPYKEKRNTYASLLSSEVNYNLYNARSRGFESALLCDLTFDEVPRTYYDALVKETVAAIPSFQRYWELQRRALGQDKLRFSDTYASISQPSSTYIDIGDAKKTVAAALAPLGKDYADALEIALYGGWVDASYGAARDQSNYTSPVPGLHPYIFLNYMGDEVSVNTLAHESAHAVHMYLSSGHPYYDQDTPVTLVTETAAALNELLLFDYRYQNAASDEERIRLLELQIANLNGTFFTQMYFAQFQQKIHERVQNGGGLSADTLDGMWRSLLQTYYGPKMQLGDYAASNWASIPHFYQGFYVYTYAGAQSAACSLFTKLKSDKNSKVAVHVVNLLREGSAQPPLDILREAGADVDGSITDDLVNYYNSLVSQLETLLARTGKI
ncbi:MAG: M3 family oligoendopeptidase [Bacillota bacterium]